MTRTGTARQRGQHTPGEDGGDSWDLHLYIMGETPHSVRALRNLERICETHLKGRYRLTVIDLEKEPHRAREDQILAVPTLLRRLPTPMRRIIGDLSETDKVLVGLDLHLEKSSGANDG